MKKPRVVGFLCNWCAATDLAEISQLSHSVNFRIIRVICSGSIDPTLILTAFERGSDGVLVGGCQPGNCHYVSGNLQAKYKFLLVKKILDKIGFDSSRLRLEWFSSLEEEKFIKKVSEFTEDLGKLGSSPIKSDKELQKLFVYAKKVATDFRLRWIISRARDLIEIENAYGEKIPEDEFEKILDEILDLELIKVKILEMIKEKGLSAEEISDALGIPTEEVMEHLIKLNDDHEVSFSIEDYTAIFIKARGGEK